MSQYSAIEWTDATWNPVRGCTKISAGCKHCYAETFAERWRGIPGHPYEYGFDLQLVPHKLLEPLSWHRSRKIFVNSMSDLFHENIPSSYISAVLDVMRLGDWHVYQVLTKRAGRMRKLLTEAHRDLVSHDHIWLGVSVENRKHGIPRIRELVETPAAVRFLSIEPLLEDLGEIDLTGIDWVIVGGESGAGARPMERSWVLSVRHQCHLAGVPFFFKQWGGVRKGDNGRTLDGRFYNEMPSIGLTPAPPAQERERRRSHAENFLREAA